jgi:hypothetical protein
MHVAHGAGQSHTEACMPLLSPKSQVKGLQAEYERVTAKPSEGQGGGAGDVSEVVLLKGKLDKLIREKGEQQAALEAAEKAKATAEAKVEAMLKQVRRGGAGPGEPKWPSRAEFEALVCMLMNRIQLDLAVLRCKAWTKSLIGSWMTTRSSRGGWPWPTVLEQRQAAA